MSLFDGSTEVLTKPTISACFLCGFYRDEEHASASEAEEDGIFGNLKDELRFVCGS